MVEEAPAPGMTDSRREEIGAAAVAAARAIDYSGAGTVEFIVDAAEEGANGPFYFMEMNTRLQVEHPVTEFVTGLDLVEWQLDVANGLPLPLEQPDIQLDGHAIEARLYAEDPERDFLPAPGHVVAFDVPVCGEGVRVDSGVCSGDDIAVSYDPMIAKVIAHGADRAEAIARLDCLLGELVCAGPTTNQAFLRRVITHPAFQSGDLDTGFISSYAPELVPCRVGLPDGVLPAVVWHFFYQRQAGCVAQARRRGEGNSPWSTTDGWRANIARREPLRFRDGDTEIALTLIYEADGVSLLLPDGTVTNIVADSRNWAVYSAGNTLLAVSGGAQYRLERVVVVDEASVRSAASGGLNAPMPGKVVNITVAAGDTVSKGETLMVLEAMKMEHAITAPGDGNVVALFFAEGEQVPEGAALLQLEALED
ncbi:MAG TPA: hypothetical protein DIT35_04085 [Rhodospirillaceae bacterium]|nr:hypothetical protein [Rhodospirillaceae bacterium]